MHRLSGKKVLILIDKCFDELELIYPRFRLMEEGTKVILAGPKANEEYLGKYNYPVQADDTFQGINGEEFDALYIPGGYASDKLRRYPAVLELVHHFHQSKKPIGFICHAGWVPISAHVLKGVKCTSAAAIKDDMKNAGADWVDEPVVIDRHFISSRKPEDLTQFCPAFISAIESIKD